MYREYAKEIEFGAYAEYIWENFTMLMFALVASAVIVLLILPIWFLLPKFMARRHLKLIRGVEKKAKIEDDFRKTLTSLLGVVGAVAVFAFTVFQYFEKAETAFINRTEDYFLKALEKGNSEMLSWSVAAIPDTVKKRGIRLQRIVSSFEGLLTKGKKWTIDTDHQGHFNSTNLDKIGSHYKTPADSHLNVAVALASLNPLALKDSQFPRRMRLRYVNLNGVELSDMNLAFTAFSYSHLVGAYFRKSDLRCANFGRAWISNAAFQGADLTGADFNGVRGFGFKVEKGPYFVGPDFTGATMTNVRLDNADLTGAKISEDDLKGACGEGVKLPSNLKDMKKLPLCKYSQKREDACKLLKAKGFPEP